MSGLASALGHGFSQLFKGWGRGISNAADNFLLNAEARKAINDEVVKKFKPRIDLARGYESKRAANIKDLGDKLNESKANWQKAQDQWQDKYDTELAAAKNQRQTDIDNYNAQSKAYQEALDKANASRQGIFEKLADDEDNYDKFHTIFTDINNGERFILNHLTGERVSLTKAYKRATPKEVRSLTKAIHDYDNRLYDSKSDKVINVFDESNPESYSKSKWFNEYYRNKISTHNADIRDAEKQIQQAWNDSTNWTANNLNPPKAWDDSIERQFTKDFKKNNAKPTYSFNGQNYKDATALDKAYKDALAHEQSRKDIANRTASGYVSKRDAEIAKRIQDAKDIKKAKLVLGAGAGAGALYAGARAMYGSDSTDNVDNTDTTNYGEPDPDFNVEKEGQALLNNEQQSDTASINTGFDPDKADALASAAYAKGVEDGNSIESSGDLGNNIGATTGGHTIDDGLFELLKAMQDPHKANAVADYIYSRYGDDPDVQRLGWRAWLNKYYGDSLRSRMNLDPSGYNGMHVSGGL